MEGGADCARYQAWREQVVWIRWEARATRWQGLASGTVFLRMYETNLVGLWKSSKNALTSSWQRFLMNPRLMVAHQGLQITTLARQPTPWSTRWQGGAGPGGTRHDCWHLPAFFQWGQSLNCCFSTLTYIANKSNKLTLQSPYRKSCYRRNVMWNKKVSQIVKLY